MTDIERVWREKSDEDLLEAAAALGDFTEEGQQVIRAELRRRGMEDPVAQAGEAAAVPEPEEEAEAGTESPILPEPECTRCHTEMRFRGTRTLLGEAGSLIANSEAFDVYVCPRCGHADLFVFNETSDQAQ